MNIEYRQDFQNHYFIIEPEEGMEYGYQAKMVVDNQIPGLLRCSTRTVDGKTKLYYDVTKKVSMKSLYEQASMDYDSFLRLMSGLLKIYERLQEYLLDKDGLILEKECIYFDEQREPLFCYVPFPYQNAETQFHHFTEYLIERISHEEQALVFSAYKLFKLSMEEKYSIVDIIQGIEWGNASYPGSSADAYLGERHQEVARPVLPRKEEKERVKEVETELETGEDSPGRESKGWLAPGVGLLLCGGLYFLCGGKAGIFAEIGGKYQNILLLATLGAGIWLILAIKDSLGAKRGAKKESAAPEDIVLEPAGREEYTEPPRDHLAEITKWGKYEQTMMLHEQTMMLSGTGGNSTYVLIPSGGGGNRFALSEMPFLIGKMDQVVQGIIKDPSVSRIHARIDQQGEVYSLKDLNSTNGTFVNDIKIEEDTAVPLHEQDRIRFGAIEYIFQRDV